MSDIVCNSFNIPAKRCPTCLYFRELSPDNHPHGFEGEGVCHQEINMGDLVGRLDGCKYWLEDV